MNPFDQAKVCASVRDRLERYIDGDLEEKAVGEFEKHIEACEPCRVELAEARMTLDELRSLPMQDCPDHVRDSILSAVAHDERYRESWWKRIFGVGVLRPALVSGFVFVLAVSSVMIMKSRQGTEQFTPAEISEAENELKWTFAYLNELNQKAGRVVADDVIEERILPEMDRAIRAVIDPASRERTNPQGNGGSA